MANVIGLTGQTGAGKSTVREIFGKLGAKVIDADTVAHDVADNNISCLSDIAMAFSCSVLNENGRLNRRALGKIVFADSKKLQTLNKIIFPYIYEELENQVAVLKNQNADTVLIDGATLIESGCSKLCDVLVSVVADEETREERIIARDGISEEDAKNRISAQHSEEYYRNASDYVISNDGTTEELKSEAEDIYYRIASMKQFFNAGEKY